jgi:hypothetical protein
VDPDRALQLGLRVPPAAAALFQQRAGDGVELVCTARSVRSSEFLSTATRIRVADDIRPAAAASKRSLAPAARPTAQMRTRHPQSTKNNPQM